MRGPITDGTWHVRDDRLTHPQAGTKGGGDGLRIMTDHAGPGSSFTVATVNPWGGGNEADAHVLAASKDLLAALKVLRDRYVALADSGDCGDWEAREEDDVIAADAAIAKAMGMDQ